MSWKATVYVSELLVCPDGTPLTKDAKLLLFLLADHHNVSDEETRPSMITLAKEALMSERHARDLLRWLERHGVVECIPGNGRGHTSSYCFIALKKGAPCLPPLLEERRHKGGTKAAQELLPNKEDLLSITPNNKKRRTKEEIFSPFLPETKVVVNEVLTIWPKQRPGNNSPIRPDLALLASRIDELLKNPHLTTQILIGAVKRYLTEKKDFPHAPEFFFGPGKIGGNEPPWKPYARMEYHELNKPKAMAAGSVQ